MQKVNRLKQNLGSTLGQSLQLHVQNLKSLNIFVTVLFIMGVAFGAIVVNTMDLAQKDGLFHYLTYFFQSLDKNTIADPQIAFQHSIADHLKTLGLMWLLGISVIGIPLLFVYIFLKGLVIGFTVGFLVHQLAWQGLWFSFLSIVPQNLLLVPVFIIVAVAGINFSITLVKNRLVQYRGTIYPEFISYSLLVTCLSLIVLAASLFEAFVSPALMKLGMPHI